MSAAKKGTKYAPSPYAGRDVSATAAPKRGGNHRMPVHRRALTPAEVQAEVIADSQTKRHTVRRQAGQKRKPGIKRSDPGLVLHPPIREEVPIVAVKQ